MTASDFANYVADRTRDFTGRKWVFRAINDWLAKTDGSRVFLLTGEPGSGKTAIAGRLTEFSQGLLSAPDDLPFLTPKFLSAVYFCSARAALRVDPREFSRSISLQLAERHEAYQRALIAAGEKEINISVQQRIERAEPGAETKGVVIENLDLSGLNPQEAFNRAVLDPLQRIYDEGFDEPITILVDALDESLAHAGRVTIAELLSGLEDLSPQVRLILTSRRDERVENGFWAAKNLFVSASEHDERNREDIDEYVRLRLQQEEMLVAKTADLAAEEVSGLVETITNKAQGNFLYVSFLLESVAKAQRSITELEGLPEGLDALYYDSLKRVVRLGGKDWPTDYAPLLGVLSVAQANLTLAQLIAFIGRSEETVWQGLVDLLQFIEEVEPKEDQEDEEWKYRLYHQSVTDFLHRRFLSQRDRRTPNRYYLAPEKQHERIVEYYRRGATAWEGIDWSQVDFYGLRYLANHLHGAKCQEELYALLTGSPEWMKRKSAAFEGDTAYVSDLDMALGESSDPLTTPEVMRLVRLLTARHVVNARVSRYAENDLHNLVLLGRQNEALAHARLRNDAAEKISGLLTMYRVLQEKGLPNSALLTEAQEVTPTLQDGRQRGSVLKDLAEALSKAGRFEEAKEVAHSIRYVVDSRRAAWTLRELAVALARAGHFEEARDVTATIEIDLQRAKVLSDVAGILTRAGSYDDATAIFDEAKVLARSIQSDEERVQALSNLTRTLAQAGRFDEGREVFRYTRNVRMSMEAWN